MVSYGRSSNRLPVLLDSIYRVHYSAWVVFVCINRKNQNMARLFKHEKLVKFVSYLVYFGTAIRTGRTRMILDCLQTGENATILPLCILVPQYDKINTRLCVWNKWIKKERNKKFGKVNNGWKKKKKRTNVSLTTICQVLLGKPNNKICKKKSCPEAEIFISIKEAES